MQRVQSLVESNWLLKNLRNCVAIDASWHMPSTGRSAWDEYRQKRIPNARFFDIDKISDKSTDLPHMLPSTSQFAQSMTDLRIANDDHVVIYDNSDVYSSFRLYWTFKMFGHGRVSVLNGGLPFWTSQSLPVHGDTQPLFEETPKPAYQVGKVHSELIAHFQDVCDIVGNKSAQIVDARSAERFAGKVPEPRPQLASGHIPGSLSLPFTLLVDQKTHRLLEPDEIRKVFTAKGIDISKPIVFTCGSGVTASVIFFAAELLGGQSLSLYDGSWSEYGLRGQKSPGIETDQ